MGISITLTHHAPPSPAPPPPPPSHWIHHLYPATHRGTQCTNFCHFYHPIYSSTILFSYIVFSLLLSFFLSHLSFSCSSFLLSHKFLSPPLLISPASDLYLYPFNHLHPNCYWMRKHCTYLGNDDALPILSS